jgi:hypothetical protein
MELVVTGNPYNGRNELTILVILVVLLLCRENYQLLQISLTPGCESNSGPLEFEATILNVSGLVKLFYSASAAFSDNYRNNRKVACCIFTGYIVYNLKFMIGRGLYSVGRTDDGLSGRNAFASK